MVHLTTFDTPYVIFDLFIKKNLLRIKTKRDFEVGKTQPFNPHFPGNYSNQNFFGEFRK